MAIDIATLLSQHGNQPRQGQRPGTTQRPGNGGNATVSTAKTKTSSEVSLEKMLAEAERLAGVEDTRHATEYGRLNTAAGDFNKGFEADESRLTNLSLGSELDTIGQGAIDQSRQLRTSLGGRGIDPSSGTAAALANRVSMNQATLKYGAMRGAAIDSYARRNAHRTAQYAQQLGIAQFGNQSPSLLKLDALTSGAEFDLAREVSDKQLEAAKYAAKKNKQASDSSAVGDVIKGIFAGL